MEMEIIENVTDKIMELWKKAGTPTQKKYKTVRFLDFFQSSCSVQTMKRKCFLKPIPLAMFHQYLATIIELNHAWVIGSISFAMVGNAAGWPSPTLVRMKLGETPVVLDSDQVSWMVSMLYLGHLVSPVPSGLLMDRWGRKRAILLLAVLPLASWVMIWFTSSASSLYIARFIAGLWAGATSTIIPIYIGEIADPELRGSLSMFTHLMRNFGVLLVYFIGPHVSYAGLAMSCTAVTVVFIVGFVFMPESPYYLVMVGREKEAYKSLDWFRGNVGKPFVDDELNEMKSVLVRQMKNKGSFSDVWYNKGNRKAFIISEVYSVAKRLTGSGVLQAYVSITLPSLTLGVFSPDDCATILGLISLLSSISSVLLAVRFNRRSLISVSSAGCAITMALVSTWFYLNSFTSYNVEDYSDWLFICFIIYNSTFSLGLGTVGTSVKGEMFAANVKAICSSLTTIFVAITSFVLNKFFLIIAESYGMHVNFMIYSISCIFVIVFTWTYVPETKGKSLEEIQKMLNGVPSQINEKNKNKRV